MKNFIEVTEGKQKVLIPISEIEQIRKSRKGFALIFMKTYSRFIFFAPYDNFVSCKETYEEVVAKITATTEN